MPNTLVALKQIRARRSDGKTIYLISDDLSGHKGEEIRTWCAKNTVEACFTPAYRSCASPIEYQFGPLRELLNNNFHYPSHVVMAKKIHACLQRHNAKHPDIFAPQRNESTRIRSDSQHR